MCKDPINPKLPHWRREPLKINREHEMNAIEHKLADRIDMDTFLAPNEHWIDSHTKYVTRLGPPIAGWQFSAWYIQGQIISGWDLENKDHLVEGAYVLCVKGKVYTPGIGIRHLTIYRILHSDT